MRFIRQLVIRFSGWFQDALSWAQDEGAEALQALADQAVTEYESARHLSGAEKRDRAVAMIHSALSHTKFSFAGHIINLAVELAVARRRARRALD